MAQLVGCEKTSIVALNLSHLAIPSCDGPTYKQIGYFNPPFSVIERGLEGGCKRPVRLQTE